MVIEWSVKAKQRLKEILAYYQDVAGNNIASNIVEDIWTAASPLADFPFMAAVEPTLAGQSETFRSLVVRKYFKIIYYVKEETVFIVTIWDCRQEPHKMNLEIKM